MRRKIFVIELMVLFVITLTTQIIAQDNKACGKAVTFQGETYNTIQIGKQCWFKKNLNVGTMINLGKKQKKNETIEKFCYNNKPANCEIYGGLYQWNEAMQYVTTEGTQGICPSGWHIPTNGDWKILEESVKDEATNLIDKNAKSGNSYTNKSGFSALFSGYSNAVFGCFYGVENYGYIWTSSESSNKKAYGIHLGYNYDIISYYYDKKGHGLSIRCLRN
jgi:uncharacterized protein (TIGR02145 family)